MTCPMKREDSVRQQQEVRVSQSQLSATLYYYTNGVLEHKWRASLKTILFLLTSSTEATENKVQFF